ncbi:FAD/NAD(P)-binding domain-containing protein [Marasmius fiardii PR-910]|nr:FAD/NAD(P)-binding domain-containing protein [Marasmius fiardii PR-910]
MKSPTSNSPSSHPPDKLRVAIIGGGIGGLTCAIALRNCKDIQVDLYEAAAELSEIGAGITVWPRTWGLLRALGLDQALMNCLTDPPQLDKPGIGFSYRKSDQSQGIPIVDLILNGGSLCFHRGEVHRALLEQLPSFCKIHLKHRLVNCEEAPDMVHMEFVNGSRANCDLLVGADGIKSVVRRCLKGGDTWPPTYSGTVAFRGLIPRERLEQVNPGHRTLREPAMANHIKHVVVFPMSQGRIINVVAYDSKFEDFGKLWTGSEVRDATTEEILKVYAGWEPEVQEVLQLIEDATCWALHDVNPLPSYVGRRILLLGDAAHAMMPHLGAGAGQAMEDAYILGAIISASSRKSEDVPRIAETYDTIRRPFCNHIVSTARQQVTYYELVAPEFKDVREREEQALSEQQLSILVDTILRNWSWASSSVDTDRQRAVAMIMASGDSNRPRL